MEGKKVFVIGLDGLSFNILDQIKEEYDLKNINRILAQGATGPLKSVLPYSSAPNWASLTTGVNPGKHGFYSFFFPKANTYENQFPNSTYIKTQRLWDIIGKSGKKVLSLNVPGTYPPQEVNGYMVTGMLTPDIKSDFSYPLQLADEIRDKFPDYSFDTKWKRENNQDFGELIDKLLDSTRKRSELFFYLLEKFPVDFAMMVFTETDRLFHSALHLIDKNHPYFDKRVSEKNKGKIIEIFRTIDASIGKIMSDYIGNGNLVLISDHGFCPVFKKVYLNNFLYEQKLFYVQDNDANKAKKFIKFLAKAVLGTLNISHKKRARLQAKLLSHLRGNKGLPILNSISKSIIDKVDSMSHINWLKTKAYYLQEWGIRINLNGREPKGIVEENEYDKLREEIIQSVMSFEDPENNKRVFKQILRREEVCYGDEFENAPDLFLITDDARGYEVTSDLQSKNIFDKMGEKTGDHSLYGMFSIIGKDIRQNSLDNISVMDVVPTVLYALGLPIPEYTDGKVIQKAFKKKYLDQHEIKYDSEAITENVVKEEFVKEDEEKIKDRLKGLGYL